MLPVLFDSKTTVNADADEIFPLLAPIQEEESSWCHHGPHARQPPHDRRRGPCDYHGPARMSLCDVQFDTLDIDGLLGIPDARVLRKAGRQPLCRTVHRALDPDECCWLE